MIRIRGRNNHDIVESRIIEFNRVLFTWAASFFGRIEAEIELNERWEFIYLGEMNQIIIKFTFESQARPLSL